MKMVLIVGMMILMLPALALAGHKHSHKRDAAKKHGRAPASKMKNQKRHERKRSHHYGQQERRGVYPAITNG